MASASRVLLPVGSSLALHVAIAALVAGLSVRARPMPQQALQIAVVETPQPEAPKPPSPALKPRPARIARVQRPQGQAPPPQIAGPPPPPTAEAKKQEPAPMVITGVTLESTSQGGSFAVGVGNTMQGAPDKVASEPAAAKPYKAEKYAPAAQVTELPRPLNGESVDLRKYYPPPALKDGFEGDVVLRLLIDDDGSVVRIEIISDPGQGLGAAAARMVKAEYRFSPAKVNGTPVATTVPFTVHFTLI